MKNRIFSSSAVPIYRDAADYPRQYPVPQSGAGLPAYKMNRLVIALFIVALSILVAGCGGSGGGNSGSSANPLPGQVILISPTADAVGVSITPTTLSWQAATGADTYDVYFGISGTTLLKVVTDTTVTSYNYPDQLAYSTTYNWQVKAKNSAGATASAVWSFTTGVIPSPGPVVLINPGNGITNASTSLTVLSWQVATDADTYDVYFSISGTTLLKVVADTVTTNYNILTQLLYSTAYNWQVKAKNSAGTTASVIWSFTTVAIPAPGSVVLLSPSNGVTDTAISPTVLSWQTATGADTYDVYFGISGTTLLKVATDTALTSYNHPVQLAYGTAYSWQVKAKNVSGMTDSPIWSFMTVAIPYPGSVVLLSPAYGATNVSISATLLSWQASTYADTYDVYLGLSGTTLLKVAADTAVTSYNYPNQLTYSATYIWQVIAKNTSGTTASAIWSFTTGLIPLPDKVVSPNPFDGATGVARTAQLSWATAALATSYDVYFGLTSLGWTVINQAGTVYNSGLLDFDTTYFWRVDSKNSYGASAGDVWSFHTVLDSPPILVSPGDWVVNENQPVSFTLVATDADGQTISYSMAGTPTGSTLNEVSGLFNWTPDYSVASLQNPVQAFAVTFTATSNNLSDSKAVTITVNNVNRPPEFVPMPGDQSVDEMAALSFTLSASDPDGDTLVYSMSNTPTGATLNAASGQFYWLTFFGWQGIYPDIVFSVSDGLDSVSATITITVNNVVVGPVLYFVGNRQVNEGQNLNFTIEGFDPESGGITAPGYSMAPLPDGATFSPVTGGGVFNWTPNFEQAGDYVVTCTIFSNVTGLEDHAVITITVYNVDRAPVLTSPGGQTIDENVTLSFTLSAIDDGHPITYSMEPVLTGALLVSDTGVFNWTPNYEQAGQYTVTFTATANSLSDSKAITITVTNVPTGPTVYTGLAADISSDSASINGIVNPQGLDTTVYVEYGLDSSYGFTSTMQSAGAGTGNISISIDLTGLISNTTYHYRVAAYNSLGITNGADRTFATVILWQVAAGYYHSAAIKSDGTLWTWGFNVFGQLGNGDNTFTDQNVPVSITADTDWLSIAGGGMHTVALKTDGSLWAWGYNGNGQLGDETWTDENTPTHVGTDTDWAAIACGQMHTVALKTDGTLWAWGLNGDGQLGDGSNTDSNTPIRITTDTDWSAIACGAWHTVAIKKDGSLWAWGNNASGQLGDGTNDSKNTPVRIDSDADWTEIACGENHTLALKTGGSLWAWGYNGNGQLGNNTKVSSNTPVRVGTESDWLRIACGGYHSLALKTDNSLYAWGDNSKGQLGDLTNVGKQTPTKIGFGTNWACLAGGDYHTIAVQADNTLWTWGDNEYGQLGDSTNVDSDSPVQIVP